MKRIEITDQTYAKLEKIIERYGITKENTMLMNPMNTAVEMAIEAAENDGF